jgi:predicted transcriptional regulator
MISPAPRSEDFVEQKLYRMAEMEEIIGLDRQALYKYVDTYDLSSDGPNLHKRGSTPHYQLTEANLERLRLIVALDRDVVFEKKEIKGIIKKLDVAEFVNLFETLPFPSLLKELDARGVPIVEISFLKPLLDKSGRSSKRQRVTEKP